jgi:hypothetical protein
MLVIKHIVHNSYEFERGILHISYFGLDVPYVSYGLKAGYLLWLP